MDNLYTVFQEYEPETASQGTFYDQAASKLDEVSSNRRARLEQSRRELPTLLQVLVLGGAVMVIALTYTLGIRSKAVELLFVGTIAALVAFSILLSIVLDRPFAGEVSIDSQPFRQGVLSQFWTR